MRITWDAYKGHKEGGADGDAHDAPNHESHGAAHSDVQVKPELAAVNKACPMMTGNKIDPDNVPVNLVRTFKGEKIGFCCGGCPGKWDKLNDEQRIAKLAAAK